MLKYHAAVIGRLIHQGLLIKEKTKISVLKKESNMDSEEVQYRQFQEEGTDHNNVTIVIANTSELKRKDIYLEVTTSHPIIFRDLAVYVFKSKFDSQYRYFCPPSALRELLLKHQDCIYSICLPKGHVVPNDLVPYYIQILQRQIERIKRYKDGNRCNVTNLECEYHMYGFKEYSGMGPNTLFFEYIERNGILAYTPIYHEIEWSFEMVERYKDQIIWLNLIEDSNLEWTEEKVLSFDNYIPHYELRSSKVYNNSFIPATGYGKIGVLSNQYIESHKDLLNWPVFAETGAFNWDANELQYFYKYANRDNDSFGMNELSKNVRFVWTPELLKTMIVLDRFSLDFCIEQKKYSELLFRIPDYANFVNERIDDPDFWRMLADGGKKLHQEYSVYFTVDNIASHKEEWDKQIEDKFNYMRRTPDTNYHHHNIFTMWDYFSKNEAVHLTYELSKYLHTITITLGGDYVLEDGIYMSEDNRFQKYNGLDVFANHRITTHEEIEKICNDKELIDVFLNNHNTYIIDYLIDIFFKDYNLEDYLTLANQMKDWDYVDNSLDSE